MWALTTRQTARVRTRAATREAVHVELAVKALEQEEIRVRRAVAEGLHGTLQSKLVLVDARLGEVLARADRMDAADAESLAWVRAELDEAREIDVREMSRLLYPDRLELGLVPALRALLGRLPASIATRLTVSDAVRAVDDPDRVPPDGQRAAARGPRGRGGRDERAQARAASSIAVIARPGAGRPARQRVENDGRAVRPGRRGSAVGDGAGWTRGCPSSGAGCALAGPREGRPPRGVAAAGGRSGVAAGECARWSSLLETRAERVYTPS